MSGLEGMCSKKHVSQLGHPQTWSKKEVKVWLNWCVEEYSLSHIAPEKFELNGKALCLLSRADFMDRVPENGDVLFNCLQSIKAHYSESFMFQQRTAARNGLQGVYQRGSFGSNPDQMETTGYWFMTGLRPPVRMTLPAPPPGHRPSSFSNQPYKYLSTSGRNAEDLIDFSVLLEQSPLIAQFSPGSGHSLILCNLPMNYEVHLQLFQYHAFVLTMF